MHLNTSPPDLGDPFLCQESRYLNRKKILQSFFNPLIVFKVMIRLKDSFLRL